MAGEPATQRGHWMRKRHAVLATLLVLGCASLTQATTLSGRVGLSAYVWQYQEVDSSKTRHIQNTGSLSLRLGQIGGQDLEILTALRGRIDLRNSGDNLSDYHVYDLQVRWKNIAKFADLTGGRHQIFWPNGAVSIDGGSVKLHPRCGAELSGYIGVLAPEDGRFRLTTYDKGHAFGAQFAYHSNFTGDLAVSFAQKNAARVYESGTPTLSSLASQTLGLDWRHPVRGFGRVYANAIYQIPTERIDRVNLSVLWRASDAWSAEAQFRYRRPNLAYNSIFWVFTESHYSEGRLNLSYRINPLWSVNAGGVHVDLGDTKSDRFELGVGHKYFSVMLNAKTGWSGKTIGVSGDAYYPVNDSWTVRGGLHVSSYEVMEDSPEKNSEASVVAGGTWHWMPQSTIDADLQYVTQKIKVPSNYGDGSNDLRFMLRLSWWFFNRLGSKVG